MIGIFRQKPSRRVREAGVSAFTLFIGVAVLECHRSQRSSEVDAGVSGPQRGESVVVEKSAAQFVVGRVVARQGAMLELQGIGDGPAISVRSSDVYRLPGHGQALARDELGICGTDSHRWVGCRVRSVAAEELVVVDSNGLQYRVKPAQVLVPSELTLLNLKHHFARGERRQRFVQDLARAGAPRAPPAWRARPGERVLALRGGHWYSARVHELGKKRIDVEWLANGRVTELPREELIPEPPYEFVPRRGVHCLTRPLSVAEAWEGVRIQTVVSTETVLVVRLNGQSREVAVHDLVPLGASD
ncbi:hypothetical protein ACFL5O_03960 [Myxococcota bacterium]